MKFVINKRIYLLISVILFLVLLIIYLIRIDARSRNFGLYVFELKNNIAVFLQTSSGKRILINGGGNSEIIRNITKVIPFYSRHIDTIISTNEEDKNITGLISVVGRYCVEQAYMSGVNMQDLGLATTSNKIQDTYVHELKKKKIHVQYLLRGNVIKLDDKTDIEVFFPVQSETFKYSKASAPELVLKIRHDNYNFFLLGNVSKKVQKFLALNSDGSDDPMKDSAGKISPRENNILILSHGLSKTNTDENFLDLIKPHKIIYTQAKSTIISNSYNIREIGSVFLDIDENDVRVHTM